MQWNEKLNSQVGIEDQLCHVSSSQHLARIPKGTSMAFFSSTLVCILALIG